VKKLSSVKNSGEENQRKEVAVPKTMTRRARTGVQQAPTKG